MVLLLQIRSFLFTALAERKTVKVEVFEPQMYEMTQKREESARPTTAEFKQPAVQSKHTQAETDESPTRRLTGKQAEHAGFEQYHPG